MVDVVNDIDLLIDWIGKVNHIFLAVLRLFGKVVDVLVGTCFICGAKDGEFISLTPDQMKQFKKEFQYPQKFVRRNNEIVAKDIKPHEMER